MTNQRTSGQNFLYALGITCLVSGGLGLVYFLIFVAGDLLQNTQAGSIEWSISRAWFAFQTTFICSGPLVLILSFALLQRFRIKP